MDNTCLLVGDIGGTNARFALADPVFPGFSNQITFQCSEFPSAEKAISAYLEKIQATVPHAICIAAAGPVINGNIRFTNNDWSLNSSALEALCPGARVRLLNDFEAIAYSIPYLKPSDCMSVGPALPINLDKSSFTIGIAGPGTGLGIAGLCKRSGHVYPITGEGGHSGFAPESQAQVDILHELRDRFDRVYNERLVSGTGIVNIFQALCNIRGENVAPLTAAELFAFAATGGNATAEESVDIFFEILGQVAGNLALVIGAFDGIYIAGGIVGRKPDLFANSRFRAGFERKGRHRALMETIPTQLILHPNPGLLGSSYIARQMLCDEI